MKPGDASQARGSAGGAGSCGGLARNARTESRTWTLCPARATISAGAPAMRVGATPPQGIERLAVRHKNQG